MHLWNQTEPNICKHCSNLIKFEQLDLKMRDIQKIDSFFLQFQKRCNLSTNWGQSERFVQSFLLRSQTFETVFSIILLRRYCGKPFYLIQKINNKRCIEQTN
jgi:hypothetical protein